MVSGRLLLVRITRKGRKLMLLSGSATLGTLRHLGTKLVQDVII